MKRHWRLIAFILLNVVVSACVTGAVLYIYDRTSQAACLPAGSTQLTVPGSENVRLEVVSVIGAGVVSSEVVVIQNAGQEAVFLTGWFLQDGEGNTYTFPQLSLNPGGTVQVHTAEGEDSALELYWGRSQAVWESGEMAILLDPYGSPHAFYRIP